MLLSKKIQFFFIFALSCAFSSSAENGQSKPATQREFNAFVTKFKDNLDYLNDRMNKIEQSAKNNDAFDAAVHEIMANITRAINNPENELAKKMENEFNKMEGKQNKIEEKLNGIGSILLHLLNASDTQGEIESGRGGEVWDRVTSLFLSTCQDKLTTWANQTGSQLKTKIERIELCDSNEHKAVNTCHPNPCLYGGRCQPTSTGSQYVCVDCPQWTSGIHCEKVECTVEKKCWQQNVTLYTVIETSRLAWEEAKVKCETLNMTLAMPKDQEKTLFLYNQLKLTYSSYQLWLGLKRDAGGSGWVWVDGSSLGDYTGGIVDMKHKTGSLFTVLYLFDGSQMWWWHYDTAYFFALCETQLISH